MTARTILIMLRDVAGGGSERIAMRLAGAWSRRGRTVLVTTATQPRASVSRPPALLQWRPPRREALGFVGFCLHLAHTIRTERPDVVLVPGNSYTATAAVVRAMLGTACPPLVWKISNALDRTDLALPVRLVNRLWLKAQRQLFDHVVAIASAQRGEALAYLRLPERRISLIPNPAISLDLLAEHTPPRPLAGRPPLLLGIGRLEPQKDFITLIRAFARIAPVWPGTLMILGEGRQRPVLDDEIRALGLGNRVTLPGHAADVPRWLAQARALVVSSRYEGLPSVLLEAMACGTPVVATRCSDSVAMVMDQGALGPLVPTGDPAALAQALHQALDRPADAHRLQARAAAFSLDVAAPLYLDLFDRLVLSRQATLDAPMALTVRDG